MSFKTKTIGLFFSGSMPDGYSLRYPLEMAIIEEDGCAWATSNTGFMHGWGANPSAAIKDYGYALVEYYHMLQEEREHLAPHLLEHLRALDLLIVTQHIDADLTDVLY